MVGLDLSLTSTGLAVIRDNHLVRVENYKTKGRKADKLNDRDDRLSGIVLAISDVFDAEKHDLDLIVVENPSYGSTGGAQHDRSGLWWRVVSVALRYAPVAAVAPATRAKYIAGHGRADKETVLAHAIERYVTPTGPRIRNDDEADAVGLADMGARRLGISPVPDYDMPGTNLASMETALWPTTG